MSTLSSGDTDARPGRSRRTFLTSTLGVAAGVAGLTVSSALSATAEDDGVGILGTQSSWRFCERCYLLFFDGYPAKGACPWGGGHRAQGWVFALNHGVGETPSRQQHWRYCLKCHRLFYWGYPDNGFCNAGGGHTAQGFDFVLYH